MLLLAIVAPGGVHPVGRDGGRLLDVPRPELDLPSVNGGDAAILYCFVFLLIAAAGPGPWSVDAALGRKRAVAIADTRETRSRRRRGDGRGYARFPAGSN